MQVTSPFGQIMCPQGTPGDPGVSYMQHMTGSWQLKHNQHLMNCFSSSPGNFRHIPLLPLQESGYRNHAVDSHKNRTGFVEGQGYRALERQEANCQGNTSKRRGFVGLGGRPKQKRPCYTKSSNKSEQTRLTAKITSGCAQKTDPYLQQLFQTKSGSCAEGLGDTGDRDARCMGPSSKQKVIKYLGQDNFAKVQTTILRQVGTFKRQLHDLHRVVVVQREMVSTERERYQKSLQTPSPQTQTKHIAPNLPLQHDPMATWFASHYGLYPCADAIYGKGASIPWWQDASRVFGDPALAAANTRGAHKEVSDKQATSHLTAQNQDNACKAVERNVQAGDCSAREKLKAPSLEGSSDWSDESSVGSGLLVDEKDSKKALQKDKVKDGKLCTIIPTAKPASPEMVAGILCALHR